MKKRALAISHLLILGKEGERSVPYNHLAVIEKRKAWQAETLAKGKGSRFPVLLSGAGSQGEKESAQQQLPLLGKERKKRPRRRVKAP